jgi:hypothetical protein
MPAFWNAYLGRQAEMQQEAERKQQQAESKKKAAAEFLLNTEQDAEKYDDPVALAQHLQAADEAGALAFPGIIKPGDLKNKYTVSPNKLAQKKLDELNALLDSAEKGGYSLDDLASSGAVLTTKDGKQVPVSTALDLTRKRPLDANGKPVAKPAKVGNTEEERFIAARAKAWGYGSVDNVDPDTELEWRREFRDAGRADKSPGSIDQQAVDLKRQMRDAQAKGDKAAYETAKAQYADIVGALNDLSSSRRKPDTSPAIDIQPGSKEYKVAEDLAFGRLTFQQFRSLYSYSRDVSAKTSIYLKAGDLNPNFNPAQFEMGYKFASNPKIQQQVASVNNVMSGVPDLLKASDAASRMGATALNKVVLPGGVAFGGRKYTDFRTAQIAFADELSGALGYGSATDMSREMGFNMTDPAMSPANFRSAIENIIVPFVQRKKASLLGPMGPYGTPDMNPSAKDPTPPPAAGASGFGLTYGDYLKAKGAK